MPGIVSRLVLVALLLTVVGLGGAKAQADKAKADRIYLFDPATKKEEDVYGKIEEESPVGLKVKVRQGKTDEVVTYPTAKITRVYYYTPDVPITDYNKGFVNEANWEKATGKKREELFANALDRFRETERALTVRPEARRYLQYRIAMLLVNAAKEDPSKREEAIKALKEFTTGNRTSFTIVNALTTQARLLEEANRADEARETYESLTTLPGVPPTLARQGDLLVGKMYLRAGKFLEAQKRFASLASKLTASDAEKPIVDVYLVESQVGQGKTDGVEKTLRTAIQATEDARVRGLAHNLLAELHLKKGEQEEAFWHYLRVDALYNEEPEEQARALFHLATLYDKVKKDPTRANEAKRRLFDDAFKTTRYQKMARDAGMAPPVEPGEQKEP
jgi:tetratricopeptide (TPR) repeat protein